MKLFLSYRSVDRDAARALEASLTGGGHEVFLDCLPEGGIPPGTDWEQQIYDGLYRSDALVALVSADYLQSQWCFAELAIARARGLPILPFTLRPDIRHPLLSNVQHLDGSGADAAGRLLTRLGELATPGATSWTSDRSPYAGLEPFDVDDSAIFFGRDAEIAALVALVVSSISQAKRHPIFVTGPSGSGKSSLVRAGLIPAMRRGGGWLGLPPFVPGEAPIEALALAIATYTGNNRNLPDADAVSQTLRNDPGAVWRAILAAHPQASSGLLLVVDQFEELFRLAAVERGHEFVKVLDHALRLTVPRISVVATLRSDAVDQVPLVWTSRPELVSAHLLPPLSRAALANVIIGPARVAGIRISDALVAKLVEDTGDGSALPFLSFVLMRLATGVRRGGEITTERYNELGDVKKALGQQANEALAETAADQHLTLEQVLEMLIELVTISDNGSIVRRRRRVANADDAFPRIVAPFVDRRLLMIRRERDETFVDVAHESFFIAWEPLAKAIEGQLDRLKLRRQVERDASVWDQAGRPDSYLWSASRAAALVPYPAGVADLSRDFLQAALDRGAQQRRAAADSAATQMLLAELPRLNPDSTLALGLALVDEYGATPRVLRCLHDALVWHRLDGLLFQTDVLGLRAASLDVSPDVITISSDRAEPPGGRRLTTRVPVTRRGAPPPTLFVRRRALRAAEATWTREISGDSVNAIAACRDIVVVSTNRELVFMDAGTGGVIRSKKGSFEVKGVEDVTRQFAIASVDGFAVRRVDDDALVRAFRTSQSVMAIRFAPGGKRVACRTAGGGGEEWDIATGTSTVDAGGYAVQWPPSIAFAGSLPKTMRSARTQTDDAGEIVAALTHDQMSVYRVRRPASIAPMVLTAAGPEPNVNFAQPPDLAAIRDLPWHQKAPRQVASTADGQGRLIALNDAWLVDILRERLTPLHRGGLLAAAFSSNGHWLALAYRTAVYVYDVESATIVQKLGVHDDEEGDTYCSVAITDDGNRVMSGSMGGGRSWLWLVKSGERLQAIGSISVAMNGAGAYAMAANHSSVRVINMCGDNGETRLLEGVVPATPIPLEDEPEGTVPSPITTASRWMAEHQSLAISPDGRLGAVAGGTWTGVFDLPSCEPVIAWPVRANKVAFGPDGRTLLARSRVGEALLSIPTADDVLSEARRKTTHDADAEERSRFGF